jgi:AAHS family 4-hydroxybenzoate transporter-like MFS transporter
MTMEKKKVDVGAVIDTASYFWVPFGITIMMIIIMLTDGFDLGTMGFVGPRIREEWGDELGWVNAAGIIGMAIGSVGMGWLGDRIGRKRSYIACLAFLFAGSMLCFYAHSPTELTLWRLVTGLGLGGVTPLAATLISEWTPKRVRSVVVACVVVSVPLGSFLAGMVSRLVIPQYGWRAMFLIGAIVPLVLFVLFGLLLPESPKYLAKHPTEHPRLAKALNLLLGTKQFDGTEEFEVDLGAKTSSNWLATIWNNEYRTRTIFLWLAFACNTFVLYAFTNTLPRLLESAGQTPDNAAVAASRFFLGGALGSIGGAALIAVLGSRLVGTGLSLLGVVSIALIGMTLVASGGTSVPMLMFLCLIAGACVNGMQAFMYAVGAHSYPTEVRGSAVGMAQTFSRVGGVASSFAVPFYLGMKPLPPVNQFFLFVSVVVLMVAISFFLIPSHIARNRK